VNSFPLSPEDLDQLVDVSVASKYGANLTQFTCVVTEDMHNTLETFIVVVEDMHNTLETFKTDLNNNLPRYVRLVVQQIQGDAQGKQLDGSPSISHLGGTSSQGNQGTLANVG
jgi:hypothetical protein